MDFTLSILPISFRHYAHSRVSRDKIVLQAEG